MMTSKAKLLISLRENSGKPISGTKLAKELDISRVAVWKTVQSLCEAGYEIETGETGYFLDPEKEKDFLYPWEFADKEKYFSHFLNTSSTMDRAREAAFREAESACVFTAEKQSAGKGRNGRTWVSKNGGLFFSILERPQITIAEYSLFSLVLQTALVRCISSICGKEAFLRWPNDIYINNKKIAGVMTEVFGEGDIITWISGGIGVNVNNAPPSAKAESISKILNRQLSRREVLCKILDEIENIKKIFKTDAAYSQGNRALAAEWNSRSDCIGAKAVVFEPLRSSEDNFTEKNEKILARGIFNGIDPAGRCVLKTDDSALFFNQGSVSLAFLNP